MRCIPTGIEERRQIVFADPNRTPSQSDAVTGQFAAFDKLVDALRADLESLGNFLDSKHGKTLSGSFKKLRNASGASRLRRETQRGLLH